jgi:hypothetical protein
MTNQKGVDVKRVHVALLAATLLVALTSSPTYAAGLSDEMQLSAPRFTSENSKDHIGYLAFPRSSGLDVRDSFLLGLNLNQNGKPTEVKLCGSVDSEVCRSLSNFTVASILPTCSPLVTIDCIIELSAQGKDGKKLEVIDLGPFTTEVNNQFLGDVARSIPSGSVPHLYRIPGAPHKEGDLYLPLVTRSGHWSRQDTNRQDTKMSEFDNTSIALYAVTIKRGIFSRFRPSIDASDYEVKNQIVTFGTDSNCVYNDSTNCAIAHSLPQEVTFGFKVNYSHLSEKWFHGRISRPSVSLVAGKFGGFDISISAQPIQSAGFFTLQERKSLPSEILSKQDVKIGKGVCAGNSPDASCYDSNLWQSEDGMQTFLQWLKIAEDRSSFNPTIWNFNSMNQILDHPRSSTCLSSGSSLVGIVSTNATQYLSGPPRFNSVTGDLEYQVAAPHLQADGALFRGSYELTIKSDYARCIYGLSSAPIKATVSVVSESGQLVAATTSQSESDGWLQLTARNFTFSSPKVAVKLAQEKPVSAVSPTPKVSTVKESSKKSITCIKESKKKIVSAKNPKCPKGYKKS